MPTTTTRRERITVTRDELGDWRWRIIAGNGRTIGSSSEGYRNRAKALRNLERVTGGSLLLTYRTRVTGGEYLQGTLERVTGDTWQSLHVEVHP